MYNTIYFYWPSVLHPGLVGYGSTCVGREEDKSSLLGGMDLCCSYHIQPKQNIHTNTRIDVMHNMLSGITRCWHANRRVFESWHSQWDFVGINFWLFQHQYYLILQFLNITQYYQKCTILPILPILLNITNITQYYSILPILLNITC